jgi:hypothetical protein
MEKDYEQIEREALKKEKELRDARMVIDALSEYVNHRKSSEAFIEMFKREHRALQQSMFRLLLQTMEAIASDDYHTDGRNEDSKAIAQTLLRGFKEAKKQEYINEGTSLPRAEEYVSGHGEKPSNYLGHI